VIPLLRGRFGRPYEFVARCPSTQRLLAAEAPEGAVVAADEQTEGRGRLGRSWAAEPGTALLFSLLLRPRVNTARLPELMPLAAEAGAEAIEAATGLRADVKHPNDLLVAGRKVAGMQAEARGDHVVLGVGVNVNQAPVQLPRETRLPATSLRIAGGGELDRAELLAELLLHLERRYDAWNGA
jgi:BirA family biotin operon repressor/biotin-[acetyl-CoA-carboxylase] ligase